MDIHMAIVSCILVFVYFALDLLFAQYESVADKKFIENIELCKENGDSLSNSEKKILSFLEDTFASKKVGWLLVMFLFWMTLTKIISLSFLKPKREIRQLDKEYFSMAVYYWGQSHLYRNATTAILSYCILRILMFLHFMNKTLWVQSIDRKSMIESEDILITSKKIMRNCDFSDHGIAA
jgi:hypothetical protein